MTWNAVSARQKSDSEETVHPVRTVDEARVAAEMTTGGARTRAARWRRSPGTVAGVVAAVYLLWVAAFFVTGHQIRDFIVIGRTAILRSSASAVIQYDPHYTYRDPLGYDGQYSYFLALDPGNARYYMDYPAYRYTRIVYPMLARAAALGRPALVPYTLLAVNLLAVVLGTLALAAWLRRRTLSPWLALLYGLSPGIFIATAGDLTEPLAYAFVIVALYLLEHGGRRELAAACACFAVAALTRETTAVFPVVYAIVGFFSGGRLAPARMGSLTRQASIPLPRERGATVDGVAATGPDVTRWNRVKALYRHGRLPQTRGMNAAAHPGWATDGRAAAAAAMEIRAESRPFAVVRERLRAANWRRAVLLVGSLAPLLAYKLFLWAWLGSAGLPAQVRFEVVPFAGLAAYWPWHGFQYVEVENVVLPALLCAVVSIVALARLRGARREPAVWALLANVLLFILLLPASSYVDQFASTRIATGVLLAALLCIPVFDTLMRGRRTWLLAAGALWMVLLPLQAMGMLLSR